MEVATEKKLNKYTKIMSSLLVLWVIFSFFHKDLMEADISSQAQYNHLALVNMLSFIGQIIVKIILLIISIKTIQLFKTIDRKKSSLKHWYYISWFLIVATSLWFIFMGTAVVFSLFSQI